MLMVVVVVSGLMMLHFDQQNASNLESDYLQTKKSSFADQWSDHNLKRFQQSYCLVAYHHRRPKSLNTNSFGCFRYMMMMVMMMVMVMTTTTKTD